MLEVGVNSYFDLEEAEQIMKSFPKKNPYRVTWDSLEDNEDKEAIIVNTTRYVNKDSMLYKGVKIVYNQPLQFPRKDEYNRAFNCPEDIKIGILLQGIKELQTYDDEVTKLKENGIHSFADGSGASVTFESNSNVTSKNNLGLYNDIWKNYFKPYTLIC